MKRYLTLFFFGLSIAIIVIGLSIDVYWSGIAAWGLAIICLSFAAYYTKYIPEKKNKDSQS